MRLGFDPSALTKPAGPDPEVVSEIPDLIPTSDQESPSASYMPYDKTKTHVVTYSIGSDYKGIYAETHEIAELHCVHNYGPILERKYVPGRAFYRVKNK